MATPIYTHLSSGVVRAPYCMAHSAADLGSTFGAEFACMAHKPIYLFKDIHDPELIEHTVSETHVAHAKTKLRKYLWPHNLLYLNSRNIHTHTHTHTHTHAQSKLKSVITFSIYRWIITPFIRLCVQPVVNILH